MRGAPEITKTFRPGMKVGDAITDGLTDSNGLDRAPKQQRIHSSAIVRSQVGTSVVSGPSSVPA